MRKGCGPVTGEGLWLMGEAVKSQMLPTLGKEKHANSSNISNFKILDFSGLKNPKIEVTLSVERDGPLQNQRLRHR
jgi:hypothetical protein